MKNGTWRQEMEKQHAVTRGGVNSVARGVEMVFKSHRRTRWTLYGLGVAEIANIIGRYLGYWVVFMTLTTPVFAQETIKDTPMGVLSHCCNELFSDSKVNDPSAIRLGAPATQRGLGKISFDILIAPPPTTSRDEVVLIQGKQTEDGGRGGEFYLGLKRPFMGSVDAAMVDAMTATVDGGFRFKLPIYAPNLFAGSAQSNVLISVNGLYRSIMQDDGNFVVYKLMPGNWLCPTWSVLTGPLPACE